MFSLTFLCVPFMYKLIFSSSFSLPFPGENKVIDIFSKLPLEVLLRYFSRSTGTKMNIGYRGGSIPLAWGRCNLFSCCVLHSFPSVFFQGSTEPQSPWLSCQEQIVKSLLKPLPTKMLSFILI